MKIMSETRLMVEQIIAAVDQLELEELTMLNKHLSKLRRERMRELTKQARQRTARISETEIDNAVSQAIVEVREGQS
jgi:tRNA uridine 5-carbamoylmethylation protein Kti12